MKTEKTCKQAYLAPETSVDLIVLERSILSGYERTSLRNMELYEMYDEEF